jgi:hypothetical protein
MKRAWLVIAALLCACARAPSATTWIDTAAQASRDADRALAAGQLDRAREQLRALVATPPPPSLAPSDRRAILQDVYFRLSEIELRAGAATQARAWAETGLALGTAGDLFTANLYIARGRARAALDDAHGAASDYRAALDINEALLAESTEAP